MGFNSGFKGLNLMLCEPSIVIYLCNKNQQDALFCSQFISIFNLYMFRAGLLLIIRRYVSVYLAIAICHAFMLAEANINARHIAIAVYTEQYLLMMSGKPARNM